LSPAAPRVITEVQRLYLYDEPEALGLDIDIIAERVEALVPSLQAETRRDFLTHHLERFEEEQTEELAEHLVQQLERAHLASEPADDYFHGPSLQAILRLLLPPEESLLSHLHVVFSGWGLALQDPETQAPRPVNAVFGEPNLISVAGLLEAPSANREYQFLRAHMAMLGVEEGVEDLEDRFAPRMLQEGDIRLSFVSEGLLLQAIFYRCFGDPFCSESSCRLFNATDQEALLGAHAAADSTLCQRHRQWLGELEEEAADDASAHDGN
jgi:hypothetical protein